VPNQRKLPFPRDLLILLLLWCVVVVFINPIGDFPLNDDWAYGQNTRALTLENRLFFSDWPAMTLIAHTLWGTLFGKVFGFSFTVLRFSTLLMGLFGLAGFYWLLQWAALPRHRMGPFFIAGLQSLVVCFGEQLYDRRAVRCHADLEHVVFSENAGETRFANLACRYFFCAVGMLHTPIGLACAACFFLPVSL
jgi:hypothetical protein